MNRTLKFKEMQDKLGLSNRQVGEIFGVTKHTVAAWRYGRYPIPQDKFDKFVEYFKSKV